LIRALALVKRSCARVNLELKELPEQKVKAIVQAADEVLAGRHDGEFPLVVWQTGSGTQTNMNMNEVLANRASELLGGERGEKRLGPPQRRGQPRPVVQRRVPHRDERRRGAGAARTLVPELKRLRDTLASKSAAFDRVVKIGRTHLQDATPITLGQEFGVGVAARPTVSPT